MRVVMHFALWSVGLAEAQTQTTLAERQSLARHATGKKRLVEVGVWHGVTTCILRRVMAPEGELFAIDPFPRGRLGFSMQARIAHGEVQKVSNGTIRWIRSTGADAARTFLASGGKLVDFVFIDGDHSYGGLKADWEGWSPLLAAGGIVALHDSHSTPDRSIDGAGSVIFTKEVILRDARFELLEVIDTLCVLRRRQSTADGLGV